MNIKYIFCFLLLAFQLSFTTAREAATPGYTVIEDKALLPIKTPTFSERKVLKIRLDNGLQALLISDPKTDQSAATLAVEAGSWQDPDQYPGIAHFLEHMLFLGTKKYPKESEYQNYITEHGGYSNAFTTNDYTTYMFSVNNDGFPSALDRFANFFKEPLFNPSGVSRELNAIDQEFAKNYENDDIREITVMKDLENPKHPNNRFTMGNSTTLSSVAQETLKKWYEDHYSANIMHLYVISKLPLDELLKLVVEDFGGIPNRDKQPFMPEMSLLNPDMQGQWIYIEPIKNVRTLTLLWELPKSFGLMRDTRPDRLLCHILGHEGNESLLADLKREKLAEGLQCSSYDIGSKSVLFFVAIDLTDEGLQHVDKVVLRCFQTIARMREKPFPKYVFDEVQQQAIRDYEYQPREDAFNIAMKNAEMITHEDLSTYPEQNLIIQKFDPHDVTALLDYMTPQNTRFLIKAPVALTGLKSTHREKWLGVSYAIKPIDPAVIKEWENAQPISEITLPTPNPFLPKSLEQVNPHPKEGEKLPLVTHPKLIINTDNGQFYYAPDQRYLIPQLYLHFNIKTPSVDMGNPAKVVAADMYIKGLEEALSKFSYPATVAGLNFTINRSNYGISLKITGYSDNAHVLYDEILNQLKDVSITEQKFKLYKQALLRDYHNFDKETPLKRAKEFFQNAIYKNFTMERQKAVALRKLTYAKFEEAAQEMFKQSFVEGLIYGNVNDEQAHEYAHKLIQTLGSEPYPKKEQKQPEIIILPENKGPFFFESKIPAQGNAVLLAIEDPEYTFKNRAAQQILMKAMEEPFFSDLRTKQQTGYIVFSSGEEIERVLFNVFVVQSNTHEPRDLLARFELFIEGFLQEVGKKYLSEENFETIKAALLQDLEKPQNNMEEMGDLMQKLAFKYDGDFDWIDKRIQGFKDLSYPEFVRFVDDFMGKANKRRLGILVKGVLPEDKAFSYSRVNDLGQLKKLSTFSIGSE
jgi:insulysin